MGVKCNLGCAYCYETDMRDAGNFGPKGYDLTRMQMALSAEIGSDRGGSWTLHGGEPLLMPVEDVEAMWKWGHERGQSLGVQTNGALITERHVDLAKRYGVHVGVSIDGPGDMNDLRSRATLEKTREATAASQRAIRMLRGAGVPTSVIVVLHKLNVDPARRDEFKAWIRELSDLGVSGIRFHPMEIDARAAEYAPGMDEYIEFYRDMRRFMDTLPRLRIDVIEDVRALLRGQDNQTTCTWNACDPYTTAAVQGVDGEGNRTNCGRTMKDGVAHPKADRAGYERYVALYHTPQEAGGCQGCRFFAMCSGQCPGEGIDGDWRNRSMYCALYMALFEDIEAEMVAAGETPVSVAPDRADIERTMVEHWARGQRLQIHSARRVLAGGAGGDQHADAPHGDSHGDHTDNAPQTHADRCHGDSHGDSDDPEWRRQNGLS